MVLSIIIPVYEVEGYVAQCLDTVLRCDLRECEVLLSLGDSTDRSSEICEGYAAMYGGLQIIRQSGKGLSNARNCAMDIAQGEYLLFLDSDDYVDSAALDALIDRLRDGSIRAEVVMTDFYLLYGRTGRLQKNFQIGEDTPERCGLQELTAVIGKRKSFWNVWRYLYRREFLLAHGIRFLEGSVSEDVDFTVSVFLAEPEILFCHSPYYIYRVQREGSLMASASMGRLSDTVGVLKKSLARIQASGFPYAQRFKAQFQFEYLLSLAAVAEMKKEDRPKAMALYDDWKQVLADSPDILVRLAAGGMRLCGRQAAACGLCALKKLRRWVRSCGKGGSRQDDNHKDAVSGELCGGRKRPSEFL